MENPFETISRRLSTIEELLLDLRHKPVQPAAPVDEVLTIDQAAEFLNLTKQTVYGLVSAGKIPYSKPTGSRLYFSRLGLIEWLKDSRRATISEQAAQYEHSRATGRTRRNRKGGEPA